MRALRIIAAVWAQPNRAAKEPKRGPWAWPSRTSYSAPNQARSGSNSAAASAEDFDPSDEFNLKDWVPIHLGPLDLSINNAVVYLFIGAALSILLGLATMRWRLARVAGTRQTIGSYLDLTLKRENGTWKVDTVTSVAALDQKNIAPDGTVTDPGASTSTTVVPGLPDSTTTTTTPPG